MNSGESWPDFDEARLRVRRMQAKLYLWAVRDADRVFEDLHNLVCDPAFLVHAWRKGPWQQRRPDGRSRRGRTSFDSERVHRAVVDAANRVAGKNVSPGTGPRESDPETR